ncbi:phosphatase PAP2 family protein [Chitinophaga sp.]|uniref:phosphatase PAP2 family protein n=1 Tax=Chitinophaga sp. TaxID=1869181 RepID=UPI002DB8D13C|nr:phosphatase PAP2 family protein [Chitinophaga sp.]
MKLHRLMVAALLCGCALGGQAQSLQDTMPPTTVHYHFSQLQLNPDVSYHAPRLRMSIASSMLAYGFAALATPPLKEVNYSTKAEIQEDHAGFSTRIDNYLQWSPAIAVYGLNAVGIKGAHNFADRSIIYGLSCAIMAGSSRILKKVTHEQRPDGSNYESFPSGHTSTAFAAAEFMRMEYRDVSPWYGYVGYAAAAATGVLRMYNNRHWFSDVVAGAGLGILSTQAAYALYPHVNRLLHPKAARERMILMPYYDYNWHSTGLSLAVIMQ